VQVGSSTGTEGFPFIWKVDVSDTPEANNSGKDRIVRIMGESLERYGIDSLLEQEGIDLDQRLAETEHEIEHGQVDSSSEMLDWLRGHFEEQRKNRTGPGPKIG
jgi:hypothetical protein